MKDGETKSCLISGKLFYARLSLIKKGRKYCSNVCKGKAQAKNTIQKICPNCEQIFYVSPCYNNRIYCSHKCKGEAKTKKGITKRTCDVCGKLFDRIKSRDSRDYKHNYCSKKCYYKRPSSHNPRWNGGTSTLPYPFEWTETLRESIRQRDKYKCQLCGCPQQECANKLTVHHIDYHKYNLNPTNLISLCKSCHSKTGVKREFWKGALAHSV